MSVAQAERGTLDRVPVDALNAAARDAMGDTPVAESGWLDKYDGYYYDVRGADPLPVLRIRYPNSLETWLYLDPETDVVQRSEKVTRLKRWLYRAFTASTFRSSTIVVLSGTSSSSSSAPVAWR